MNLVIFKSCAKMPSSCRGAYANLGLIELDEGYEIKDVHGISERYKAVKRVLVKHERLHVGKTDRSEFGRVLAELRAKYPNATVVV